METYKKNDGVLNSSLGNMFADATFELINPIFNDKTGNSLDIVILNNGGIRSIISEGPVSEKTAFELMPFENSIVVVKLKGKSINRMIDYLAKVKLPHPMKGLEIVLSKKYEIKSVLLRNNPIDENKYYFVATTDYLLDGGDKMYFLAESVETTYLDYKMRDVLIDYFIKTDTLKLKTDNRFIIN
jgi:2',3'-cyclic-nucleotide 2'-phosphodiesterase (5'-nucleotidase family)